MKRVLFFRSEDGASAVEFAIVVFPFFGVILAGLGLCFMMWANATLHYATEDAARCAAVKTSICTDASSTENYAAQRYQGPAISPVFHYAPSTVCGHSVTASATYPLNAGLFAMNIPLSASACFP